MAKASIAAWTGRSCIACASPTASKAIPERIAIRAAIAGIDRQKCQKAEIAFNAYVKRFAQFFATGSTPTISGEGAMILTAMQDACGSSSLHGTAAGELLAYPHAEAGK